MVSPAEPLKFSQPSQEITDEKPTSKRPRISKGVKVGPVLIGGFDFAHPDFIETSADGGKKTRFVRIWDQGGMAQNWR